jgi:hypothetical protein
MSVIPVMARSTKYEDQSPGLPGQESKTLSPKQPEQKKVVGGGEWGLEAWLKQ